MKLKTASTFLLIASIIWLLNDLYWFANGFIEGWLKMDKPFNILLRILMFCCPIALIFLSSALVNSQIQKSEDVSQQSNLIPNSNSFMSMGNSQIQKSEDVSQQSDLIPNGNSFMSIGDWLITFLICAIPIVGIVMMFIWALGNANPKKTWAQAALIFSLIITVLYAFVLAAFLA